MILRRAAVLAMAPLVLSLLQPGPATAGGPPAGQSRPSVGPESLDADRWEPGGRAADGARRLAEADGWTDGVVRRHAVLRDVESISPNPQHQLTSAEVAVDLEGQVFSATAAFAQAPADTDAVLGVVLGTWDGSSCLASFMALTTTVSGEVQGQFVDGTAVALSRSSQGASISLSSAPHPRLRETAFECAYATVLPVVPDGSVLSRAFAENVAETYRPVLEVEPGALLVAAKAGRWATLRATVRNDGRGDSGPVRLQAAGTGVQVRPGVVDLAGVRGRSSEQVELKVRLKPSKQTKGKKKGQKKGKGKNARAKDPRPRPVTLSITSAGTEPASARVQVGVSPRPTKPRKLTGSYWWGWEQTTTGDSAGWINHAVWFVNAKWAYLGWPEGRKPSCSAKVKDCVRYTYSKRTGKVRIGKKRAKVTSTGFTFAHPGVGGEKIDFHPLTLPPKNTELQTDLLHQNWAGYCLIMCNSWTERLSFGSDGRFVRSEYSVGSWPGLNTAWGTFPPDQRGTYRVVAKGIVELSYDDGKRERHVLGIQHDASGRANPVAAGLLLRDVNYYYGTG
ncbi:hypothetical protein [Nocardioides campestrisoli]|uniref:hypothetical protein n=1 Tax=Nocardioides campestrisoli TaxID=2736757 RepID=UPI00163DB6E8|nr:hypothetical protein [Nocardioides campestrisoli]